MATKVAPLRILLTAGAGFAGAVAGYVGGFYAVGLIEPDDAGLEWMGYWLLAGALGLWAGFLAGVWAVRRFTGEDPRASWLLWTVVISLPLVGGAAWIGMSFNDQDDNMPLILEYGLPVVAFALSVLAGRWLSRRAEER